MDVIFCPFNDEVIESVRFSVIVARYQGQWALVRRGDRATWEIPGGHREPGEHPNDTARRELVEETGAHAFTVKPVALYGVDPGSGELSWGALYFAEIMEFGPLPAYEITELRLVETLDGHALTYPHIQPALLKYVIGWLACDAGKSNE